MSNKINHEKNTVLLHTAAFIPSSCSKFQWQLELIFEHGAFRFSSFSCPTVVFLQKRACIIRACDCDGYICWCCDITVLFFILLFVSFTDLQFYIHLIITPFYFFAVLACMCTYLFCSAHLTYVGVLVALIIVYLLTYFASSVDFYWS